MRIISGSARGTRLRSLSDPQLRPMLDRVKEALFNILQFMLNGARILDLFSGTGSLGLEALSREAQCCVFVESDPDLAALIRENAAHCHLEEGCRVVMDDVLRLPRRRPPTECSPADIVLADPPYAMVDDPNERERLFATLHELKDSWIAPAGLIVLHHRPMPYAVWPSEALVETDQRIYGESQLTFLEWRSDPDDG
ncbi:MAG: 16S rRNA (guanine(966)-N(2))-methyltransferase RsmD [Planctomycetota bacterium]